MQLKFDAFVFNANLDVARVCEHFESLGFSLIQHSSTLGYRYAYLLELGGINHGLIQYGGDSVGTGVSVSFGSLLEQPGILFRVGTQNCCAPICFRFQWRKIPFHCVGTKKP